VGKVTLGHRFLRVHCLSPVIIPPMPHTHLYPLTVIRTRGRSLKTSKQEHSLSEVHSSECRTLGHNVAEYLRGTSEDA